MKTSDGFTKSFLVNTVVKSFKDNKDDVSIFLLNGVRLDGTIEHYDDECMLLEGNRGHNLIFKSGVLTIQKQELGV